MQLRYIYVPRGCPVPCADHLIPGARICGNIIQHSQGGGAPARTHTVKIQEDSALIRGIDLPRSRALQLKWVENRAPADDDPVRILKAEPDDARNGVSRQ